MILRNTVKWEKSINNIDFMIKMIIQKKLFCFHWNKVDLTLFIGDKGNSFTVDT